MAQVAFSIRMDEKLKRDFGQVCSDVGMSMSTAFVIFAKETLRARQIPFSVGTRQPPRRRTARRDEGEPSSARDAWEKMRAQAQAQYKYQPEPTLDEINAMIAEVRRERHEAERLTKAEAATV